MLLDWNHGDSLEYMRGMDADSVDLIATDPPYFKVKGEPWDRQWDKPAQFIAWLDQHAEQWQRILRPNGSLYVFASPHMSARVECMVAERFEVLNRITWAKSAGWWNRSDKEELRAFFPASESIIFAEQRGADGYARGESSYTAKCDELRGFVFLEFLYGSWGGRPDREHLGTGCGIQHEEGALIAVDHQEMLAFGTDEISLDRYVELLDDLVAPWVDPQDTSILVGDPDPLRRGVDRADPREVARLTA